MHLTFQKLPKGSFAPDSFLNPVNNIRYSPDTLICNWYVDRYMLKGPTTGIVPGLDPDIKCTTSKSCYQQNFEPPKDKSAEDIGKAFIEWKTLGFCNYYQGHRSSSFRWIDSDLFMHNMTTTKTVFEKGLKKAREYPLSREDQEKYGILRRPEEDIMKSYGNKTETGLRAWKRCFEFTEHCRPKIITNYQESYLKPMQITWGGRVV